MEESSELAGETCSFCGPSREGGGEISGVPGDDSRPSTRVIEWAVFMAGGKLVARSSTGALG